MWQGGSIYTLKKFRRTALRIFLAEDAFRTFVILARRGFHFARGGQYFALPNVSPSLFLTIAPF